MTAGPSPVSVVVPAHNEAGGIRRVLDLLTTGIGDRDVQVVVACNGCTDGTADVAREYPGVVVLDLPEPSKRLAMKAADDVATHPVRAYLDADVGVSREHLLALVDALDDRTIATGPERRFSLDASSWPVRWYYDVWSRLPAVREGLFGRGLIVLAPQAHERVRALPLVLSDDLAISEAFSPEERRVVPGALAVIEAPRTVRDLVRRRIRIATGNTQLDQLGMRSAVTRTSVKDLLRIAAGSPALALKVVAFVAITGSGRLLARRRIRRGDYTTWSRDQSSRG
ncbi:MAG: glycosyltransferase [Actinobacteria bacterium]|nr:glycosyltransferase [Actinomycetota bacterium]